MKARAYAEIKKFLQRGDLAPGSFVAERQLAAGLGMSKTPVRAALERLEAEGFVAISPQQGIIIRDSANQEILRVMGQLREKIQRVITKVFQVNAGRIASSYQEHRAIAEAVLGGDAA